MKHAPPLDIDTFLTLSKELPVFDVRTLSEHIQGKIPNSISLPIFNEHERAAIGTTYKQLSREEAILLGFDYFGVKMRNIVESVRSHSSANVLLYCWRGGMRSEAVAWLVNFYGINAQTLDGGYKTFRRYALSSFDLPRKVIVLGGRTGSRKTAILAALYDLGEQVIDLEALAQHKGSAFGSIGMPSQISNEQFENELALEWRKIDPSRRVWLEDESQKIGKSFIPQQIYDAIRNAPVIQLFASLDKRIEDLIADYGQASSEQLANGIRKIERRLGGYHAQLALEALGNNDLASCFRYILNYYDKAYDYSSSLRNPATITHIEANDDCRKSAENIIMAANAL